tara:strand:+ start:9250 stop:10827 length:1578 start_codon:yes stop_codon:yes gene_type:complete
VTLNSSARPPALSDDLTILITANQAYPAFEALFLAAQNKIELGFRIFDPLTKLHSDAARKVGSNWADLIVATLNRGVEIAITLSDFDPIVGYNLHRRNWKAIRIFHALNEMTTQGAGTLRIKGLLHPAQGGLMSRLLFAPQTRKKLNKIVAEINDQSDGVSPFKYAPRLRGILDIKHGKVVLRPRVLPQIYPVTLHQKMAVVDGQTTYIGGLDLNDRRYDDQNHNQPAQDTWHDVQIIVHDRKIAGDASDFLQSLPDTTAGVRTPRTITSAFRTTLSRRRRSNLFTLSPKTISDGLLQEHFTQIKAAREFIYIETQYFRDRRIAKALADAANRSPNLKFLLLLPVAPSDIAFEGANGLDARFGEYLQARAIRRVRKAFGNRFFVVNPVQPRSTRPDDSTLDRAQLGDAPIVYVHAKVSMFDDTSAIISSANLNGRSMKWDVETGVVLTDHEHVKALRDAAYQHWLPAGSDASYFSPSTAFESWTQLAKSNAAKTPDARQGFVMPYDLDRAKSAALVIPGAPEELV